MRPDFAPTLPAHLCSVTEAAQILGVSRQRVHRIVQIGAVVAHRRGGWWVLDRDSLAEYAVERGRPQPLSAAVLARRRAIAARRIGQTAKVQTAPA